MLFLMNAIYKKKKLRQVHIIFDCDGKINIYEEVTEFDKIKWTIIVLLYLLSSTFQY